MKKYIVITALNIFFAILQLSFFSKLFGNGYAPDLILAFAFALLFLDLDEIAYFSGFIGGIFLDLLGFSIIGSSSVLYVGVLLIFFVVQKFVSKGMFLKIIGFVVLSYVVAIFKSPVVFSIQIYNSLLSLFVIYIFYGFIKRSQHYFKKTGYNINRI